MKREVGIFGTSPTKAAKISIDNNLFAATTEKDDLFTTTATTRSEPLSPDLDLFSDSPTIRTTSAPKPRSQPVAFDDVFDSPEDIFASSPPGRQAATGSEDIFAPAKDEVVGVSGSKKLDDLFSSPSRKAKTPATIPAPASDIPAADETPKVEEAEKKKVKKPKKNKGRPDEDLFGNTDDIFADVPDSTPKKTTTKKKRKKTAATAIETEAGGDGGGTTKKATKKKKAKKPVDQKDFTLDTDDIFN